MKVESSVHEQQLRVSLSCEIFSGGRANGYRERRTRPAPNASITPTRNTAESFSLQFAEIPHCRGKQTALAIQSHRRFVQLAAVKMVTPPFAAVGANGGRRMESVVRGKRRERQRRYDTAASVSLEHATFRHINGQAESFFSAIAKMTAACGIDTQRIPLTPASTSSRARHSAGMSHGGSNNVSGNAHAESPDKSPSIGW